MSDSPQGWQYPQVPMYPRGPVLPGAAAVPPRPPVLQRAVILMYVGAAAAFVNGIVTGVATHLVVPADSGTSPSQAAQDTADVHIGLIVISVISGCLAAGLWLWMAWKTGSGRSWARVLSTVFFGISSLGVLIGVVVLGYAHAVLPIITSLAEWGVGLAAFVNLWQRDSSNFFAYANQLKLARAYGRAGGYQGYMPPPYGQPPQPGEAPPSGWNV